jgi:hypothetical protein
MIVAALPGACVVPAIGVFLRRRRDLVRATRDGLVTPFDELGEPERVAPSR